jgi:hypothetical protein
MPEVDRSMLEVDRSMLEVDRSMLEVDRSMLEVDRSMLEVDRSMSEIDLSILALDRIALASGGLGASIKSCLRRFHPPFRRLVGRSTHCESRSAEGKNRLLVLRRNVRCLPVPAESRKRSM